MSSADRIRKEKLRGLEQLFLRGDWKSAILESLNLIQIYKSATAYNIYALCQKKLGNYSLASKVYEELLIDNPNNTLFLGNLGNIYHDMGQIDKAESLFKKCLLLDVENFNVSISLGNVFVTKSLSDKALRIFQGILKCNLMLAEEQKSDVNYRIAEIYRTKGSKFYDLAITHYNKSRARLSTAHKLELIYLSKSQKVYLESEAEINRLMISNPLLAAIQKHASIRYNKTDDNLFCKDPFKYIQHYKLTSEDGFTGCLIKRLIRAAENFDRTPQALLDQGHQTAGNFLLTDDPSIKRIKLSLIHI